MISIICICAVISNIYIIYLNNKYNKFYKEMPSQTELKATIIEEGSKREYYYRYIVKIEEGKFKNKKLYLLTQQDSLKYGQLIYIKGEYIIPSEAKNYKGFDYREYLKTKKIYGTIKVNKYNIKILKNNNINKIFCIANKSRNYIKNKTKEILPLDCASLLNGILIGDKSDINENIIEDFKLSNLSHMLAVSGTHVGYIIIGLTLLLNKIHISKKWIYVIMIIALIIYLFITNFTVSIIRACIMSILVLISNILHRKSDIATSISISTLVILIYNPFSINDIGFQLSYLGTIGIILFTKNIEEILNKIKLNKKVRKIIATSTSAQIMIAPIMAIRFNTISLTFIIGNILATPLLGASIILGFVIISLSFVSKTMLNIMSIPLNLILNLLLFITNNIAKIPMSSIIIKTPYLITIILWYIIILMFNHMYKKNFHVKKIILHYAKNTIAFILIILLLYNFFINFNLKINGILNIHFIDVGQGDSTLIVTPNNKKILIDGGEANQDTLSKYLLNRRIKQIDYLIISHFDSDHSGGCIQLFDKIIVKNIIIGKQFEKSEDYEKLLRLINKNNIKNYEVQVGERINIEKNLYLDILWPDSNNVISENILNNNSLVFKLIYKNFSMLFTGDIEKIAEEEIINKNLNKDILNCDVLKVAHHGSKTSSCKIFIEKVNPKIALIGVGLNNKFGHPSNNTLENLEAMKCKIYRTDENGEVSIKINKKGKIWIKKMLN